MDRLIRNARFAVRMLAHNRLFAAFAVLTLGLGIGANTAMFSVVDGVLLKPLPYAHADRLLLVRESAGAAGRTPGVSIKELYDFREQTQSFAALVEYHQMNFDLLRKGSPDRVNTGVVSHDFFNVLGIRPLLGRTFVAADDRPGADAVLVLSNAYWHKAFGADPSVVGRVFQMNDRPHTVVGVLPDVPLYPQENDVYMPVSACPFRAAAEKQIDGNRRAFAALTVFGLTRPGVTRAQADADVRRIGAGFVSQHADVYKTLSGFRASTLPVRDELTRQARPLLLILLGTTGFVLLIACSNIANLSVARLLRRERELAIRAALGAGRGQIIAQLLTESTLLALAGGAVGLLFASWTLSLLTTFVARFTSRTQDIGIDPGVLAFTIGLSLVTGIVFGILPALSSRADLAEAMKQGSRAAGGSPGRHRLQRTLIVLQVAVSAVLLVGAGLLLTSVYRLQQVDPGYRGEHVVSAEAFPNFTKYPTAAAQAQFYRAALDRLLLQPGVASAAVTNAVPLSAITPGATPIVIKGESDAASERQPTADVNVASPRYFETLGIPLLDGRDFTVADTADAPRVAIVNASMAREWRRESPIGAQISGDDGKTWATIVGIAGDTRQYGLGHEVVPEIFVPLAQAGGLAGRFIVRVQGDPAQFARQVGETVHAIDPDMPVKNVVTLEDLREDALARPRLTAMLLVIFAVLALVVTVAGISGVIAISVTNRLKEFGLRLALGANPRRILASVVMQAVALVAVGLAFGLAAAAAATRVLSAYLYDTRPSDPITLAGVCVVFIAAGALSGLGPALRATSADPLTTLRAD